MNDLPHSLREIFAEALEIEDPRQRVDFLAQACGSDAALRREVEELLAAEAASGKFLPKQPPATSVQHALLGAVESFASGVERNILATEKPGDRIGRYKLLEKIGEGGCGIVYMAAQEEPVRRKVALKVIKLGMDTKAVIARFDAERQALAMMDHPNIAKVFDAGVAGSSSADFPVGEQGFQGSESRGGQAADRAGWKTGVTGRPYFVMELVRGIKITDYCDHHQLATRARLELFIQVCQAVQHAHQKGIIHRDLKPSNILVTVNDGVAVPKVIDFGIAKATEGKLTDQTLFTAFEQFLGTPAYMSPEQAAMTSLDIDTRSDIYSLGVLLYELLTGTTPFDTKELLALGVDELRRTIREKEPKRPSTRLTQELVAAPRQSAGDSAGENGGALPRRRYGQIQELIHQLRGDLDWIVMKCLEKDRVRRYETANGLASDLKRHLNNEPVLARPPSRLYEFQKTVRRHKVAFAATAAVILALVAGVIGSSWQAIRATRAERRQKAESYTSDMNLAKQAWDEGNLRRAVGLLTNYFPKAGEPDLRGFEWRYLWNLFARDESLTNISIPNDRIKVLASSPAHSFVVVCCNKTIRLLDPATGNELHRFSHPDAEAKNAVFAIALSPGATNLLAVHRADGVVTLWDLERKTNLVSFQAVFTNLASWSFSQGGKFLALSPDGKFLAVGGPGTRSSELILWDISSVPLVPPRAVWTNEVTNGVMSLAFTSDGRTLVGAESFRGSTLRTWDVMTGVEATPFPKRSSANLSALAISPDGSLVAASGVESRINVFDFANRTWKCAFDGHSGDVQSLAFSSDSHRLISSGADGTVRIWDVPSQKLVGLWRDPHKLNVYSAVFTPDGSSIFSADDDEVRMWSAEPRPPEALIETREQWGWLEISPDGKWLVTSDSVNSDGSAEFPAARVWDIAARRQKFYLAYKNRHPLALAFSSKSNLFALGDVDKEGVVGLWNTANWNTANSPVEPFAYVTNGFEAGLLCFSPDGKVLTVAGLEFVSDNPSRATNRLAFWEVGSWQKLNLLPGAGAAPNERSAAASVAFSNDGRLLAIGYRDGWVRLWDFKQQRLLKEFKAHESRGFGGAVVQFSGDDRWLVSILKGRNSLVLFDLTDLEHARTVLSVSDPAPIWWATFAPDNKSLVTADNDGLVKFWSLQTLRVALTLRHSYGPGGFLAFSPEGNLLASKDAKGVLKLWTAPSLEEIDRRRKGR